MRINLKSDDMYEKMILNYLEENASDELVEKINAGTKTMANCMTFIKGEARTKAMNGVAMIEDKEVYGWAVHFFEEDSIKPVNEPKRVETTPKVAAAPSKPEVKKAEPKKSEDSQLNGQMSIFEILGA